MPRVSSPDRFFTHRRRKHTFSSAVMFPGWAEYGDEPFLWRGPATYDPLVVYQPKTWLLRVGWTKAGAISCREVPSAKR